jgi:two-component system alkaline phosphatase synthesis response regulator PhoP
MQFHVLLVEGAPGLGATLSGALISNGLSVETFDDRRETLAQPGLRQFDLAIACVGRSCSVGIEFCLEFRNQGKRTPILIVADRECVSGRIQSLRAGADDYIVQPVDIRELLARIHALIRRWKFPQANVLSEYKFGCVLIDFLNGTVHRRGEPIHLSAKELRLLQHLITHSDSVQSRKKLLREVWGYLVTTTRTVDVHVAGLRQKLEDDPRCPRHILTVRRAGYMFRN